MADDEPRPQWTGEFSGPQHERGRIAARISPPPVKRHRSGPENDDQSNSRLSTANANLHFHGAVGEVPRRRSNAFDKPRSSQDVANGSSRDDRPRQSFGGTDYIRRQHASTSRKSSSSRPDRLSSRTSTASLNSMSKPVCIMCSKTTNVKYDPMIACPGCHKHYHDSCRRPPLIEGVDSSRWRCIRCLKNESEPIASIPTAPRAFFFGSHNATRNKQPAAKGFPEPLSTNRLYAAVLEPLFTTSNPDSHHLGSGEQASDATHSQKDVLFDGGSQQRTDDGRLFRQDGNHDLGEQSRSPKPSSMENGFTIFSADDADVVDPYGIPQSPLMSDQSSMREIERTEIPNTPTQRSSQLNIPSSTLEFRTRATDEVADSNSSSLPSESGRPRTITALTVLCLRCQTQRVLARKDIAEVMCRGCQQRSLISEAGTTEIPETPEATVADRTVAGELQSARANRNSSVTSQLQREHPPLPWYVSGVVASKPKITQRRVGGPIERGEVALSPAAVSEHESPRYSTTHSCFSANLHRLPMNSADNPHESCERRQSLELAASDHRKSPIGKQSALTDDQQETESKRVGPTPQRGMDVEKLEHTSLHSSLNPRSREATNMPVQHLEMHDAVPAILLPDATPTGMPITETTPLSETAPLNKDEQGHSLLPSREKRYTNRELARLALVAANGKHLTATEIIVWLADTFPYLRVRERLWEGSVRAVLSKYPEFHAHRAAGAPSKKGLWGFASPELRAQYETEYAEYSVASHSPAPHPPEAAQESAAAKEKVPIQTNGCPQFGKAKKSAPSKTMSGSPMWQQDARVTTKIAQVSDDSRQVRRADFSSNPFVRSERRQPLRTLEFALVANQVTSYRDTLAWPEQPSVETMTEAEKAKKIAEIKARPSRKRYFGSDHRLAHKRRQNLEDIHDERDGAWSLCATDENRPGIDQDIDMGDDEKRTLREVFDLPANMIPMNDGHTELAFRDGTRINGRLPRPRNVFKVGKMFGGELTIRTT